VVTQGLSKCTWTKPLVSAASQCATITQTSCTQQKKRGKKHPFPVNRSISVVTLPPKCSEGIRGSKPAKNPTGREFPVTVMGASPFTGAAKLLLAVAITPWGQAAETALPRPPPARRRQRYFPGQMGPATRLANAVRARSPPSNVNRAVGRSECCQALIKASCAGSLAGRPSSHSPCPVPPQGPKAGSSFCWEGKEARTALHLTLASFGMWKKSFRLCQELLRKNRSLILLLRQL